MASKTNTSAASYIDVIKGFRRLGNAPLDSTSKFSSLEEAKEYARQGAYSGSAYPGQVLSVAISGKVEPEVYVICNDFTISSLASTLTTEDRLAASFSYETGSRITLVSVPAGYVLNQLTVHIDDHFVKNGYEYQDGIESIIIEDVNDETTLATGSDIDTSEDDSEFIIKLNYKTKTISSVFIVFGNMTDVTAGTGTLKFN